MRPAREQRGAQVNTWAVGGGQKSSARGGRWAAQEESGWEENVVAPHMALWLHKSWQSVGNQETELAFQTCCLLTCQPWHLPSKIATEGAGCESTVMLSAVETAAATWLQVAECHSS